MDFENRFGLGMPNFDNLNRMCARAGLADSTADFSYFLFFTCFRRFLESKMVVLGIFVV